MKARVLILSALRLIGVIPAGEAAEAQEATDALEALNMMLSSASADKLLIPYIKTGNLTVSAASVVLTVRPLRIEQVVIRSGDTDYPTTEISMDEYQGIAVKTTSGRPTYYAWDKVYPTSRLYLYPTPDMAYTATLRRWDALTSVATLDTEMDLPGEYLRALKYNLAIEVSPEYGIEPGNVVAARAAESLALITRLNAPPVPAMLTDLPLQRSAGYRNFTIESY